MSFLKKLLVEHLRVVADKIEAGNSNLTEEQAMEILSVIANEELSKDQACSYIHKSRSTFDKLVKEGKIPKGKKIRGRKELTWNKKDLVSIKCNP